MPKEARSKILNNITRRLIIKKNAYVTHQYECDCLGWILFSNSFTQRLFGIASKTSSICFNKCKFLTLAEVHKSIAPAATYTCSSMAYCWPKKWQPYFLQDPKFHRETLEDTQESESQQSSELFLLYLLDQPMDLLRWRVFNLSTKIRACRAQ